MRKRQKVVANATWSPEILSACKIRQNLDETIRIILQCQLFVSTRVYTERPETKLKQVLSNRIVLVLYVCCCQFEERAVL